MSLYSCWLTKQVIKSLDCTSSRHIGLLRTCTPAYNKPAHRPSANLNTGLEQPCTTANNKPAHPSASTLHTGLQQLAYYPTTSLHTGLLQTCTLSYDKPAHRPTKSLYTGLPQACTPAYNNLAHRPTTTLHTGLQQPCTLTCRRRRRPQAVVGYWRCRRSSAERPCTGLARSGCARTTSSPDGRRHIIYSTGGDVLPEVPPTNLCYIVLRT